MGNMPQFLVNTNLSPDILTGRLYFPKPSTPVPPSFLSCRSFKRFDETVYGSSGQRMIEFVASDPYLYFILAIYCPHPKHKFRTIHLVKRFFDTYGYGCHSSM